MRILFHGPSNSLHRPAVPLPHLTGIPAAPASTLAALKETHNRTGNRGNLIHGEAPVRILRSNIHGSAVGNIAHLHKSCGERFPEVMSRHFDLVVFSMANFIARTRDLSTFVESLKAMADSVPFIVLGAGLQGRSALPEMQQSVQETLAIFNEKAKIFGVRGHMTEKWLHKYGFPNAKAIGCPSLYLFPRSIEKLAISPNLATRDPKILSAGYLTVEGGRNFERGKLLARAFQNVPASYVFQDEFFEYGPMASKPGSFDEATSTGDRVALNALFTETKGVPVDFDNYYYFPDPSTWRQVAAQHDVYCGDRFHGGVAALQVGRPALFMAHDNRVSEMADFYALPHMTTQELVDEGVHNAIKARITPGRISDIKKTYGKRLEAFRKTMNDAGIKLNV